jgi:DNA helicase-2/ATP-dependent DNA helicase PcrA
VNPEDILLDLNEPQREAVKHGEGPLLVLAGAGSGKTRVITRRIAYLLSHGVPPRNIVAVTFTNKAAQEMLSRVQSLTSPEIVRRLTISTFHSFCARLLRSYAERIGYTRNFSIADERDSVRAVRAALDAVKLSVSQFKPAHIAETISRIKNSLKRPEDWPDSENLPYGKHLPAIYEKYQDILRAGNMMDFDDLLLNLLSLLGNVEEVASELQERVRYLLIDEYQDTNIAQYGIAKILVAKYQNITATGDPDQSIYGWRGAEISNILEFAEDFPNAKVVKLEENYRSTQDILTCAQALIENNRLRIEKTLFTNIGGGEPVKKVFCRDETNEAAFIASTIKDLSSQGFSLSDIAVFYRVNALSRAIEDALREHSVPYCVVAGLEFYARKEIKDILAYLDLLTNESNNISFLRVVNIPPRGIGETTVERVKEFGAANKTPLIQAARQAEQIESLPKRAVEKIRSFVALYDSLIPLVKKSPSIAIRELIARLRYEEYLRTEEDSQDRMGNVRELVNAASQFEIRRENVTVLDFLQEVALASDADAYDESKGRVSLMTLHAAKGLEFPVAFIAGVEEGLIPHEKSLQSRSGKELEEERRLLFVGMTRAKKLLYLTYTRFRAQFGQRGFREPSTFLDELPRSVQFLYLVDEDLTKQGAKRD